MANLTYLMDDLEYYVETNQVFLRYATQRGPLGCWSEEAFVEVVPKRLAAKGVADGPLKVLGIGSGAGNIDCDMMHKLLPYFPVIHNTIVEPSEKQRTLFKQRVKENQGELPDVTFTWRDDTLDEFVEQCVESGGSGGMQKFHLIHLMHSLYYTDHLDKTLKVLHGCLEEGGVLFINITPHDSVYVQLADIQIRHGSNRPTLMHDKDVTDSLYTLGLTYQVDRGVWHVPSSVCFDENSRDGHLIVDFLTHTKNFRQTASDSLKDDVMKCIKDPTNSETEDGGEVVIYRDWVHITVVKGNTA